MNLQGQITAETSLQVAAEAEESFKECHERATTFAAQFGMYREQAIREFESHSTSSEVEQRLDESQAKTKQRLVDALGVSMSVWIA